MEKTLVNAEEGIARTAILRADDTRLVPVGARRPWHVRQRVHALISSHSTRRFWAERLLAACVPRFFGLSIDEVYTHQVTEAEARLAVARSMSCPSWEVLVERVGEQRREQAPDGDRGDPFQRANRRSGTSTSLHCRRLCATIPRCSDQPVRTWPLVPRS